MKKIIAVFLIAGSFSAKSQIVLPLKDSIPYLSHMYTDSVSTVTTEGIVQYYAMTNNKRLMLRIEFATRKVATKYNFGVIGCPPDERNPFISYDIICYGWHPVESKTKIIIGNDYLPDDKWYQFIPLTQVVTQPNN